MSNLARRNREKHSRADSSGPLPGNKGLGSRCRRMGTCDQRLSIHGTSSTFKLFLANSKSYWTWNRIQYSTLSESNHLLDSGPVESCPLMPLDRGTLVFFILWLKAHLLTSTPKKGRLVETSLQRKNGLNTNANGFSVHQCLVLTVQYQRLGTQGCTLTDQPTAGKRLRSPHSTKPWQMSSAMLAWRRGHSEPHQLVLIV